MKHAAYRLFKKPFFGRFVRPWRWPAEAEPEQWQPLQITSGSGATLSALLAKAHGEHAIDPASK